MLLYDLLEFWWNVTRNKHLPSLFVAILECILFTAYLILSCMLLNELYSNELWLLFGLNISFFLLPFIVLYLLSIHDVIEESYDHRVCNPLFPLMLSLEFITLFKFDFIDDKNPMGPWCNDLNERYFVIKICNLILLVPLLLIPICLSPIMSIVFILQNDDDDTYIVGLYPQFVVVVSTITMQIITFCVATTSNLISTAFLYKIFLITLIIGMTQLITKIYIIFEMIFPMKLQQQCLPFIIITELLLLLNIIFIAFMDLYEWNTFSLILIILSEINILFPNIPFSKTYLMNLYLNISTQSAIFKYIKKETHSQNTMCKMFCILLLRQQSSTKAIKANNLIKEQYEYSQMTMKEQTLYIEKQHESKYDTFWMKCIYILYGISSLIAFISPLLWIIWITLHIQNNRDWITRYIFVLLITISYLISLMLSIYVTIKEISMASIKYVLMLNVILKNKNNDNSITVSKIDDLVNRQPSIHFVLNTFQYDIGMIILSFLFKI